MHIDTVKDLVTAVYEDQHRRKYREIDGKIYGMHGDIYTRHHTRGGSICYLLPVKGGPGVRVLEII